MDEVKNPKTQEPWVTKSSNSMMKPCSEECKQKNWIKLNMMIMQDQKGEYNL